MVARVPAGRMNRTAPFHRSLGRAVFALLLIGNGCGSQRASVAPGDQVADIGVRLAPPGSDMAPCWSHGEGSPLERYVQEADAGFRWDITNEERSEEGTLLELRLVSQRWQGAEWRHPLFVFVPAALRYPEVALLVLRQGAPADRDRAALQVISRATGTAAAFLFEIPNQPLLEGREEDPLLAYTFSQYLRTGDASWPLLFPMVKSVVRAMDVVEVLGGSSDRTPIDRFIVAGHSKRGHTAWLSGATDPRILGIIPMSSDVLNSPAQIMHHRAVAGEIRGSSQIFDEVIQAADSPRGRCLIAMIDPFTYRDRLSQAKLVVLGTNDDYTPTDALNLYWDELPGPKSVLYLANTDHVGTYYHPDVNPTAFAFARAVASGSPMPEMDWQVEVRDGVAEVRVTATATVRSARLWTSTSAGRDFRRLRWSDATLQANVDSAAPGGEAFLGEVPVTAGEFTAIFAELEFQGRGTGTSFKLSTQIRVLGPLGVDTP